ncbi:MAG: DUF748 domain-containing protein [Desulfobulbaceae bacterium]|nr:DUF748 domain-containing protein [Desulfobulbaceae bacterium]
MTTKQKKNTDSQKSSGNHSIIEPKISPTHLEQNDEITLIIDQDEAAGSLAEIPLSGGAPPAKKRKLKHTDHKKSYRRQKPKQPPSSLGRQILTWVLIFPVFIVFIYGLLGFMVVPTLIKSTVAKKLSEHTGRRIMMGNVLFSPFTLNLKVSDLLIGADKNTGQDEELLRCKNMNLDFNLMAVPLTGLLINKLEISGLELNLNRYDNTDFNVTRFQQQLFPEDGREPFISPARVSMNEIIISNSRIIYTDLPTGKRHRIEEVDFILPPSNSGNAQDPLTPSFKGVVNGSPVVVNGVQGANKIGEMETRLSLNFKDVQLVGYQSLILPSDSEAFLTDGEGDCTLQVIFTEHSAGKKEMSLRGVLQLRDMALLDKNDRPLASLPEIRATFVADPRNKLYRFEKLIFDRPDIHFYTKKEALNFNAILDSAVVKLFNRKGFSTKGKAIDQLKLEKGTFTIHHKIGRQRDSVIWKNLTATLSGYADRGYHEAEKNSPKQGSFSLSGESSHGDEKMKLLINGEFDNSFSGKGEIALDNIYLPIHQRFFFPNDEFTFTSGVLDLKGDFRYSPLIEREEDNLEEEINGLILENGTATIKDYTLVSDKKKVVTGVKTTCSELKVNISGKNGSIGLLELKQHEFFANWWQQSLFSLSHKAKRDWDLQLKKILITDSIAHASFSSDLIKSGDVILDNISLSAERIDKISKRTRVSIEADINKKGHFSGKGDYDLYSGQATLKSSFSNLDLDLFQPLYSSWLVPSVTGGTVNAKGDIHLPRCRFFGSLDINNLQAGRPDTILSWSKGTVEKIALTFQPFHFGAEQVVIEQPVVNFNPLPGMVGNGFLLPSTDTGNNLVNISPIEINSIELKDGSGYYMAPLVTREFPCEFTGVHGTLSSIRSRGDIALDLKGKLRQGGIFELTGSAGLTSMKNYKLRVRDVPLSLMANTFKKRIGTDVGEATADWEQRVKQGSNLTNTELLLKKLKPSVNSAYRAPLSLLVDKQDDLRFSLKGQKEDDSLFMDNLFKLLARYKVKSAIAPELVLKEFLPKLSLNGIVNFEAGKTTSNEVEELTAYRTLLNERPLLSLQLIGGTDTEKDTKLLTASLIEEAENKLKKENERRAQKRKELLEAEQKRLASIKPNSGQVVVEQISSEELIGEDLQPLPPVEVTVEPKLIDEIAKSRARFVYDYFIKTLGVNPERIVIAPENRTDGTKVTIKIQSL